MYIYVYMCIYISVHVSDDMEVLCFFLEGIPRSDEEQIPRKDEEGISKMGRRRDFYKGPLEGHRPF